MGASVFWVESLPGSGDVVLGDSEGHHAGRVLRVRPGEEVIVTDGRGGRSLGVVSRVAGGEVVVALRGVVQEVAQVPRLVVVQAIPKGDRGELAVELMTELGADEIVPWRAERNVVRWRGDRGDKALGKWRSAAFAAAKQARRSWFPEVDAALSTAEVCQRFSGSTVLVLHEEASEPLVRQPVAEAAEVVLVVGPEGGISASELVEFESAGAVAVRLGRTVMRTSTAGAAGLAVVSAVSGRLV